MGRGAGLYELDRDPIAAATGAIQATVEVAVAADLLILAINARQASDKADVAFVQAWDRWFIEHPRSEVPPAVVVLTGVEGAEFGNGWQPPYDWSAGHTARERGRPAPASSPSARPCPPRSPSMSPLA